MIVTLTADEVAEVLRRWARDEGYMVDEGPAGIKFRLDTDGTGRDYLESVEVAVKLPDPPDDAEDDPQAGPDAVSPAAWREMYALRRDLDAGARDEGDEA